MEFKELTAIREIAQLLQDNPELPKVLEMLHSTKMETLMLPVKADKLVGATEAKAILKVSKKSIYDWERRGLLKGYYTPDSRNIKFWLSDIMALPSEARGKGKGDPK